MAACAERHGLSSPTLYKWKAKYGGMNVSEARLLKALEEENARLKRVLADSTLDNVALKDLPGTGGDGAYRAAAAHLQSIYAMSERWACRVLGVDRTSVRYRATRPDDVPARSLKALAQECRRFCYRRLYVMLRREGHAVNKKRVQRIYCEEKLTVRRRGGRKRAIGTRRPLEIPLVASQRWSLDFVSDQMTDRRRLRILKVIETARESASDLSPHLARTAGSARAGRHHSGARADPRRSSRQRRGIYVQRHPGLGQ